MQGRTLRIGETSWGRALEFCPKVKETPPSVRLLLYPVSKEKHFPNGEEYALEVLDQFIHPSANSKGFGYSLSLLLSAELL